MTRSRMTFLACSAGSLALAGLLTACPGPKVPSGPPPEYEIPPPPTWLRDAGPPTPAPPVLNPVPPDDAGPGA